MAGEREMTGQASGSATAPPPKIKKEKQQDGWKRKEKVRIRGLSV